MAMDPLHHLNECIDGAITLKEKPCLRPGVLLENLNSTDEIVSLVDECMKLWRHLCRMPMSDRVKLCGLNDDWFYPHGYELKKFNRACDCTMEYMQVNSAACCIRNGHRKDGRRNLVNIEECMVELCILLAKMVESRIISHLCGMEGGRWRNAVCNVIDEGGLDWGFRMAHTIGMNHSDHWLVAPHVDPSFASIDLCDKGSKTEYLDYATRTWSKMSLSRDSMAIFGGIGLQYFSANECKALCHRVAKVRDENETFGCTFMIDLPSMRFGSKASLKCLNPGATYDASFVDMANIYHGNF